MGNSPSQAEFHPPTLTPPTPPRSVSAGGGLVLPNSTPNQKQASSHSAPSHNLFEERQPLKEDEPRVSGSRPSGSSPNILPPVAHFRLPPGKSQFSWATKADLDEESHSEDSLMPLDTDPNCSIRSEDLSPCSLSPQETSTVSSKRKTVGAPFHHPLEFVPESDDMIQSGYEVKDDQDVLGHFGGPYDYQKDSLEMECPYRHPTHPSLEEDSITSSTLSGVNTNMESSQKSAELGKSVDVSVSRDKANVGSDNVASTNKSYSSESEENDITMTEAQGDADRESPSSSGFVSDLDPASFQNIQIPTPDQPQLHLPSSETLTEPVKKIQDPETIIAEANKGVIEDSQNTGVNTSPLKNEDAKIPILQIQDEHQQSSAPINKPLIETQTDIKPEKDEGMHQIKESEPPPKSSTSLASPTQNENNNLMQLPEGGETDLDQGHGGSHPENRYISVVQISGRSLTSDDTAVDEPPTLDVGPPVVLAPNQAEVIPVQGGSQPCSALDGKVVVTTLTQERNGSGADEDSLSELFTQICLEDVAAATAPSPSDPRYISRTNSETLRLLESESLDEFESLEAQAVAEVLGDNVTLVPVHFGPSTTPKPEVKGGTSVSQSSGPLVISCNEDTSHLIKPISSPNPASVSQEVEVSSIPNPSPLDKLPSQSQHQPSPSTPTKESCLLPQVAESDVDLHTIIKQSPKKFAIMQNPMQNKKLEELPSSSEQPAKQQSQRQPQPQIQVIHPPPPETQSLPNFGDVINSDQGSSSASSPNPPPSPSNMNGRAFGKQLNGTFTPSPGVVSRLNKTYSIVEGSSSDSMNVTLSPLNVTCCIVPSASDSNATVSGPPSSILDCSNLPSFTLLTSKESKKDVKKNKGRSEMSTVAMTDMSQTLEESTAEKFVLIKERDQALEDLNNVESAFADVHRKYERSKGVLQNLKDNEITLLNREQELVQKIENRDRKLDMYKEAAQAKLELMYQDYEHKIKEYEVENTRLRAQCRLMDMKLAAYENDVEQKAKENAQLNALCNELISGQGSH